MTLRTRLLVTLAGSGLAILLGSFVAREIAVRYASEASIDSSIEARLTSLDRETCEANRDFERRPRRTDEIGGPSFRPGGPPGEPEFPRRGPPPDGMIHIQVAAMDFLIPSDLNTVNIRPGMRRNGIALIRNANRRVWSVAKGGSMRASNPTAA